MFSRRRSNSRISNPATSFGLMTTSHCEPHCSIILTGPMAIVSNTEAASSPCSVTQKGFPASETPRWSSLPATPILHSMIPRLLRARSCQRRVGATRHGCAVFASRTKPRSNTCVCSIMTRRMTTTSWTNWQPKQPTYAPEQSLPERVRLSICDQIDRRGGDRLRSMLVERKQRSIVVDVFGVEDGHRTIVQDQPALFMPNGNDCVPRLALLILHNDEAKIVGSYSQFPKCNIFHDCVVFAVAGSAAQRLQGRSPEVGNAILHPIACRPYGHVDCAIDPSKTDATLALGADV